MDSPPYYTIKIYYNKLFIKKHSYENLNNLLSRNCITNSINLSILYILPLNGNHFIFLNNL